VRAFIAIDVDKTIRDEIQGFVKSINKCSTQVRWTEIHNIHLTIKFLGEITESKAFELKSVLGELIRQHQTFELIIKGTGCFPNLKTPKILWLGIERSEQLHKIHEQIEEICLSSGIGRQDKPFSPHITIARIKDNVPQEFTERIMKEKHRQWGILSVTEVLLMKSLLKPEGPIYSIYGRFPLSIP